MPSRPDPEIKRSLEHHFKTRARHITTAGAGSYLVPTKYDTDGNLLTEATPDAKKTAKFITLHDWKFLECWRRHDWDTQKAQDELGFSREQVKRLVKRVAVFKDEEVKDKALAAIPTPTWVQARHVENIFSDGKLGDSERDSLKELAKISGAYKNTAQVNIQQNIFQMPELGAAQQKALQELADKIADVQEAQVVNDG